jgi:hypothetical protein
MFRLCVSCPRHLSLCLCQASLGAKPRPDLLCSRRFLQSTHDRSSLRFAVVFSQLNAFCCLSWEPKMVTTAVVAGLNPCSTALLDRRSGAYRWDLSNLAFFLALAVALVFAFFVNDALFLSQAVTLILAFFLKVALLLALLKIAARLLEGRAPPRPLEGRAPPRPLEGRAPPRPLEGRAPPCPPEGRAPPRPPEGRAPPRLLFGGRVHPRLLLESSLSPSPSSWATRSTSPSSL